MEQKMIDFLLEQGCIIKDKSVYTARGDYVGWLDKDIDHQIEFIYKHKLTDLQSINTALGIYGPGKTVEIGFNEEEQKYYGWTHRGYGSFGIGYVLKDTYGVAHADLCPFPIGYKLKTLEECKIMAAAMADYLD